MTEALREAITAVYRIQPEALKTLYSAGRFDVSLIENIGGKGFGCRWQLALTLVLSSFLLSSLKFVKHIIHKVDGVYTLLVNNLGIHLRHFDVGVSHQFAAGVDVCTQRKHERSECVPGTVKSDVFVNFGSFHPLGQMAPQRGRILWDAEQQSVIIFHRRQSPQGFSRKWHRNRAASLDHFSIDVSCLAIEREVDVLIGHFPYVAYA